MRTVSDSNFHCWILYYPLKKKSQYMTDVNNLLVQSLDIYFAWLLVIGKIWPQYDGSLSKNDFGRPRWRRRTPPPHRSPFTGQVVPKNNIRVQFIIIAENLPKTFCKDVRTECGYGRTRYSLVSLYGDHNLICYDHTRQLWIRRGLPDA